MGKSGEPAGSWRQALAFWVETANEVLLETQRGEAYLATQRKQLSASTELRLAQRELIEHYGEMLGVPTRSEIDELHRTVTELRREVRALQRRLAKDAPSRREEG
jgi:polyhydroxyalkanoate synthesis regulator phasin